MMVWHPLPLEDFEGHELERLSYIPLLPKIVPNFDVAPLEDRPQNPILDSLKLSKANENLPKRRPLVDALAALPPLVYIEPPSLTKEERDLEFWKAALERRAGVRANVRSWDRLRVSHSTRASSTPFLSEQSPEIYSAVRSQVFFPSRSLAGSTITERIDGESLLQLLSQTVLGVSSTLHIWDASEERFVQSGTEYGTKAGIILVDNMDEVVSASYISRFTTIGTLLRRLESLVVSLRARAATEGPTIHAFAHSLSSCIVYIQDLLQKCPPSNQKISEGVDSRLVEVSQHYTIPHELLTALAELCMRDETLSPDEYPLLDSAPIPLLSRIYTHLQRNHERHSHPMIRAVLAFVLTATSQDYLQRVSHSVGFGGRPPRKSTFGLKELSEEYVVDLDEEEHEDIFDMMQKIDTHFPSFFPPRLQEVLPAAQKSLILLDIAEVNPASIPSSKGTVVWRWSSQEIEAISNGVETVNQTIQTTSLSDSILDASLDPALQQFAVFDLEPGSADGFTALPVKDKSTQVIQQFVEEFPSQLPAITPTLPQLTGLVFQNLARHSALLSNTLLNHFLTSDGPLNFRSHLTLLQSFLLISSPAFKSRLLASLFSDEGEYAVDKTPHSVSIRSLRRPTHRKDRESKQPWAVGISPNLLDKETWPPVGADLSFFLRTVIVDSLGGPVGDEIEEKKDTVTQEASWRLGFAIRDLPMDSGKEKWLDPLRIEALDFLYMDYKPPHPLEILIPPDVLSKYQRMFAFLLRLMRLECAMKSLFRMATHRTVNFLFPTLTPSRKLLLHFRFVAQSFVSALSGYVFDTVIGGNFAFFVSRLSSRGVDGDGLEDADKGGFSDVFELAQGHSSLLDDVLSACLLRSGQKAVGDLLRQSMEIVLELAIVVGELHRGRMEEYHAAPLVEEMYHRFRGKMSTFTKVLKGLVNKTPSAVTTDNVVAGRRSGSVGGLDALYHLLIRLDLGEWWNQKPNKLSAARLRGQETPTS